MESKEQYHNPFIVCVTTGFLIVGLILLFGKIEWFPDYYDVRYMGVASLIAAILILYVPYFTERRKK